MHPVFEQFKPYSGVSEEGVIVDWIGDRIKSTWYSSHVSSFQAHISSPPVPVNEEYFEWVDVLTAAAAAGPRFVMVELGAGFGRWGTRGALAAKQRGCSDIKVRFVEPEPEHIEWIKESILMNALGAYDMDVMAGVMSYTGVDESFAVECFTDIGDVKWYGQSIGPKDVTKTNDLYYGHPVVMAPSGRKHIMVKSLTLENVLHGLDVVDLIDMDIQGSEDVVVERSIATLNAQVRRVHIGTHGRDIETKTRSIFIDAGWTGVWDYSAGATYETPYGRVEFGDGVQSWINPRLQS